MVIKYRRDDDYIKEQIDLLGYFVIITSKEMSAGKALERYRSRDEIEKLFRTMKTSLEYSTLRVHSQKSLESKTYLIFLASIIRNEIYKGIKPLLKENRKEYTVTSCVNQLERISATINNSNKYRRVYSLTAKQKKILSKFGIDEQYLDEQIKRYSNNKI